MADILKRIEQHVEKGLLVLAAAFMLYVFYAYFISTPNAIEFAGAPVSPGKLNETILAKAQELRDAVQRADQNSEKPTAVVDYGKQLREKHQAGIFAPPAPDAPTLPASLRVATGIGKSINVPGLEETEEAGGDVQLVRPLPPRAPVVATGRSLLLPQPTKLAVEDASLTPTPTPTPPTPATETKPIEQTWVTVVAYFDKKGQYNEQVKNKYAVHRANVYIAGVDLERQEMGPDGNFGEQWQPVAPGKVMPEVILPEPVLDDESGAIVNREAIDKAFKLVQREQSTLMQPAFPIVSAGDPWELPTLEGMEPKEEPADKAPVVKVAKPPDPEQGRRPPTGRRPGSGGGEGGRGVGPRGGGGGQSDDEVKADLKKAAKDDLDQAKQDMKDKKYQMARDAAARAAQNPEAVSAVKKEAEELVRKADELIARESLTTGTGRSPRGEFGEGFGPRGGAAPARAEQPFVKHPTSGEPAVWFHDDSVVPGKTYRYRLRVKLWNRYVGKLKALTDPSQAKAAVIAGEWSLPTEPITVAPTTYFFAKSPKIGSPQVLLDVFKWQAGKWLKQGFEAGPGDVIGDVKMVKSDETDERGRAIPKPVDFATNAVVLDIRPKDKIKVRIPGREGFTLREQESLVVVYLDPLDGQVKERVQAFDRNDPIRKKIEE